MAGQRRCLSQFDAVGVGVEEQQTDAVVLAVGLRGPDIQHDVCSRQPGAGAPHLLPVDHKVVSHVDRRTPQSRSVRTDVGLTQRDDVARVPWDHLCFDRLPLGVRAPFVDGQRRDQRADVAHRDVEAGAPELLGNDCQFHRAAVVTAGLLRKRQTEPTHLGHRLEEFLGVGVGLVPLLRLSRRAVPVDELPGNVLQRCVLRREAKVHYVPLDPLDDYTTWGTHHPGRSPIPRAFSATGATCGVQVAIAYRGWKRWAPSRRSTSPLT